MTSTTRRLSFLLLLSTLSLTFADDWPQFRGPAGDGHAKADRASPTEWSATKNVLWKQDVPGSGWSSPVIVNGKVYLTTADTIDGGDDLSLRALCLDAKDGKTLWNVEVFRQEAKTAPNIHKKNSHASPTPIVANGRVYVHFGHQGTACLDLAGKPLWTNRDFRFAPVHGNGGSPVLVDDLLVFSTDGAAVREVIALESATGKLRWRTKRSGSALKRFSFSTPTVITVGGTKQIVSAGSDHVGAYDPATGKELWHCKYEGYSVIPKPVFAHGMVYVCTGYNTPSLLAIRADGSGDVTDTHVAWTHRKGVPNTASLLIDGDELYMVSDKGFASCLDAKTGQVHWSKRLPGSGYSSSPILAGGHVYFLAEDGVGTVAKAGKTYEQVARNDIGERTLSSYAVADGSLFLRTAGRLYRLGK